MIQIKHSMKRAYSLHKNNRGTLEAMYCRRFLRAYFFQPIRSVG